MLLVSKRIGGAGFFLVWPGSWVVHGGQAAAVDQEKQGEHGWDISRFFHGVSIASSCGECLPMRLSIAEMKQEIAGQKKIIEIAKRRDYNSYCLVTLWLYATDMWPFLHFYKCINIDGLVTTEKRNAKAQRRKDNMLK